MLNGLDLFSGIGGLTIALAPWVRPVAYCEIDRYAQSVLLSRMSDGSLPCAPIWDDVTSLDGSMLPGIDIIYGGFPCQDISCAGNGAGLEGKRSGLFFEIARLCSEIQPRFIFLENVPAITSRGLGDVLGTLSALGYDCRWDMLRAYDVGAPHKRERWWCLAYSNDALWDKSGWIGGKNRQGEAEPGNDGQEEPLAHAQCGRRDGRTGQQREGRGAESSDGCEMAQSMRQRLEGCENSEGLAGSWTNSIEHLERCLDRSGSYWATEPDVGRVAYGVSQRVDRIKCLGNSVVPAQAREAFKRLIGYGCQHRG